MKDGKLRNFLRKLIIYLIGYPVVVWPRTSKIKGLENIPEKGGAILCGNHIHAFDTAYVMVFSKRHINTMSKAELYEKSFALRLLKNIFNLIPVNRDGNDFKAIKEALKLLKNNELLYIMPEGTRHGILKGQDFQAGATYIALKSNVPIIPIGYSGSFKVFDKNNSVNIGKPIYLDKLIPENMDKNDKKLPEILMKKVRSEIVDLLEKEDKKRYLEAIEKLDGSVNEKL